MNNTTGDFLAADSLWTYAFVNLEDVQPLFGGVRLSMEGNGRVRVEVVIEDGRSHHYRYRLRPEEAAQFWRLSIAQDFLTIRPAERPGLPDEARPAITEGDTVTVYYLPAFPRFSRLEAAQDAAGRAAFLFTAHFTLIAWLVGLGGVLHGLWPLYRRSS